MSTRSGPRVHPRAFKLELMRQWSAGERSCAQLVREHGLAQSVLYRWRAEYVAHGEDAFTGLPGATGEPGASMTEAMQLQRIGELERALGKATLEIQLLKKGRILADLGPLRSDTP